jgi:hypothetical protein
MEDTNKDLTIAALMEANELLGELLSRYRRSNTLLRRINSDLRRLKNIQASNDEEFRSMCQGDFYIEVDVQRGEGGLPDPQASQTLRLEDGRDVSSHGE